MKLTSANISIYGKIDGKKKRLFYRQPCGHNKIGVHDEDGNIYFLVFLLNHVCIFTLDDIWKYKEIKLRIGFLDRINLLFKKDR